MGTLINASWVMTHSSSVLLFLLSTVIKGTVILAMAWSLIHLLGRLSSSGRHLICSIALACILALPAASLLMPSWEIPVAPSEDGPAASQSMEKRDTAPVPVLKQSQPAGPVTVTENGGTAPAQETEKGVALVLKQGWSDFKTRLVALLHDLNTTSVAVTLLALWGLGALIISMRYFIGRLVIWRISRQAHPLSDQRLMALSENLSRRFEITGKLQVLISDKILMPMTWGLINPRILLPADIDEWTEEHQDIVMLHEFAHVKQFDSLTQMLVQLAKAIYWFNPLIWMFNRQFQKVREYSCDDFVLQEGSKASSYAELLLDIATNAPPVHFTSLTSVAMARKSQLEGRLLAIMNPKMSRKALNHVAVSFASVLAFALVLPLAAMKPRLKPVSPPAALKEMASETNHDIEMANANSPELLAEPAPSETDPAPVRNKKEPPHQAHQAKPAKTVKPSDDPVIQSLCEALNDPSLDVRMQAAETLSRMDRPEAVAPLIAALDDENRQMRQTAAEALGHMKSREAVSGLIHALKDPEWQVRYYAADALGDIEDQSAVDALMEALPDAHRQVRMEIIESLGELEDRRSVPALMGELKNPDWEIRSHAVYALDHMDDPRTTRALIDLLDDEHRDIRLLAMDCLEDLDDTAIIEPLAAQLDDEDWRIRLKAAEALGEFDHRSVVGYLSRAARDSHREVRLSALDDLSDFNSREAADALMAGLKDSDEQVRMEAVEGLGEMEDIRSLPQLVECLNDESLDVQVKAIRALGELEDARALTPLMNKVSGSRGEVALALLDALGEIDDPAASSVIIPQLQSDEWECRKQAAWALGEIRDPGAVRHLLPVLKDSHWEVRKYAAWALGELGDRAALSDLSRMMKDENEEVRRTAARAIGEIE